MKVTLTFDSMEEMEAFRNGNGSAEAPIKAPQPIPQAPVVPPMMPQAPVAPQLIPQAPVPTTPQPIPQAPVPTVPQTMVPTTAVAQEYTYDQLAVAAAGLMNAGKGQQLHNILQNFGVQAMTELPKERYGEFATAIRAEGAVI